MKVVFQYKDRDGKDQELVSYSDVPSRHDKIRISNWPKSEEYFTVVDILWALNKNDIGQDEPEVLIQLKRATSDWLGL